MYKSNIWNFAETGSLRKSHKKSDGSTGSGATRGSRSLFSQEQVSSLEQRFREQSFLSREERQEVAEQVGITERQVMVWFQNRRYEFKLLCA